MQLNIKNGETTVTLLKREQRQLRQAKELLAVLDRHEGSDVTKNAHRALTAVVSRFCEEQDDE